MSPYYVLLIIPACWSLIIFAMSRLSGWSRAARAYELRGQVASVEWRMQSARIGLVKYGGCVVFGRNERGITMRLFPLFALGHKPLFVPFSDIAQTEERFILAYRSLRFAKAPGFTVRIGEGLAKKLLDS
jgi:hypothetical protein